MCGPYLAIQGWGSRDRRLPAQRYAVAAEQDVMVQNVAVDLNTLLAVQVGPLVRG